MSLFVILLGGELEVTPRLMGQVAGARIIAADGGMTHAEKLGVTPELWVGDFDSADQKLAARYAGVERAQFPAEKDMTDSELAIAEALERGATSFILVGAFGGPRIDHAFLHLTVAISIAETGLPMMLTSGSQEGYPLLHGVNRFEFVAGTLFSVLPFSDLEGLTISGAKWPLDDVEVPFGSSLTISNVTHAALSIQLKAGRAMLLVHPDTIL